MRAALSPALLGLLLAPLLVIPAPAYAQDAPAAVQVAPLSAAERAHLVRAREEQKMARDLYMAFAEAYPDARVFRSLEREEGYHMGRVYELLTTYEIPDPVGAHGPGYFEDQELQRLYTAALAEGRTSYAAALRATARVEELDLVDLARALDASTTPALDRVFEQLARGSRRHLRTAVQALAAAGETYAPQHLSREAFDAVLREEAPRGSAGAR